MSQIGITLLIIGLVSLFIQNTWYGYMDAEGFIHDSIFLPFGVIALIIGVILLTIAGGRLLYKKISKQETPAT